MARVLEAIAQARTGDDDGIALAQSVAYDASYVLTAGAASFPAAQVEVDSSANESASMLEITGILAGTGQRYTEYIQGPPTSGVARTQARFTSIIQVRQLLAATVGNVSVGWGSTGYSRWLFLSNDRCNYTARYRVLLRGTGTFILQATSQAMNRDPTFIKGRDPDDVIDIVASGSTALDAALPTPYQALRIAVSASNADVVLRVAKSITG